MSGQLEACVMCHVMWQWSSGVSSVFHFVACYAQFSVCHVSSTDVALSFFLLLFPPPLLCCFRSLQHLHLFIFLSLLSFSSLFYLILSLSSFFLQNKSSEFCAPLTSFDWNETDPSLLAASSIDTTCTIWSLEVCYRITHEMN